MHLHGKLLLDLEGLKPVGQCVHDSIGLLSEASQTMGDEDHRFPRRQPTEILHDAPFRDRIKF